MGPRRRKKIVARQKPLAGSRVAARQIASYIRGESGSVHVRRAPQIRPQGVNCAAGRPYERYTHAQAPLARRRPTQRQSRKITIVHNRRRRVPREGLFRIIHPRRRDRDPRLFGWSTVLLSSPLVAVAAPKCLSEIHDKHDSRT